MEHAYIYQKVKGIINLDEAKPIESTQKIRNEIISKFFQADNLSFLLSNGCSGYAGSQTINRPDQNANCSSILKNFKFIASVNKEIQDRVNSLSSENPEMSLDKLFELKLFFESTVPDVILTKEIVSLIEKYKESFIKQYVLKIDYRKNHLHRSFIKRLLSRDSKLAKPNLFTLNYDLLIEKTAEQLGVYVCNGFIGFHERAFYPSSYQIDFHVKNIDGAKRLSKSINLYKLHGSLSWYEDPNKPPYGIGEKQVMVNENGLIDYEDIKKDTIIYPIQSKKKHTLDLPYSEMLRQFVEALSRHNSVLVIIGYSFSDEHINDIIANAIANPDFNLVIFSYEGDPEHSKSNFLKELYKDALNDNRISLFYGPFFGSFETIVNYLMPYTEMKNPTEDIFSVFQSLKQAIK